MSFPAFWTADSGTLESRWAERVSSFIKFSNNILDNLDTAVQDHSGVVLSLSERSSDPPSGTDGSTPNHFGHLFASFWTPLCRMPYGVALSLRERYSDPPSDTDGTTAKPFWTSWTIFLVPVLTFNFSRFSRFPLPRSGLSPFWTPVRLILDSP